METTQTDQIFADAAKEKYCQKEISEDEFSSLFLSLLFPINEIRMKMDTEMRLNRKKTN